MQPLTPQLWVGQSRFFHTNSGVFASDGQAVLIDPCMLPQEIDAIVGFVAKQAFAPVWLVLTHSHWDHILGPERFSGVPTVAQAGYLRETGAPFAPHILRQVADWEAKYGIKRARPFEVPKPDRTFAQTTTIEVGQESLKLHHAPGHAADQLVVYHARGRTLWASDILSDVEIPFVSHSLAAFEATLLMLADWEVETLVPGHGHPSTTPEAFAQRVAEDRAYLAELRQRVWRAIELGQAVEEAVERCASMGIRHPKDNAGPHKLNVESAYLELGGPADAGAVGWRANEQKGEA